MLNLNPSSPFILTADIGGSHISVGICQLKNYQIVPKSLTIVEVNSHGSATEIFSTWESAFQKTMCHNPAISISGLSIAMPGPFDYDNGISKIIGLGKYESLYGKNIKQYLVDLVQIEGTNIRFRNDAESTIAGEVLAGAGKGYDRVMGVTLGTGFGAAFTENKATCDLNLGSKTFKLSIADDYLSTRWFVGRYAQLTGLSLTDGVRELALIATKNDLARSIFSEFASNMADFLTEPIRKYKPDVLIICGNIARNSAFFLPELLHKLAPLKIKLAMLYEDAALIGAASLFDDLA